ncbi:MAG: DUF4184 family protein [Verrucomicrobia bacterium]|nr:DUF4184 family protein [Verrucomicrobiota bacterium]
MPFPLAHPAVVLPLRKIQWLSLSAMMLGCLTPDVSYAFRGGLSRLAHTLPGSVLFCLPVGLLGYWLFRAIREPLAALLPAPHRQALLPLCRRREHTWPAIVVSVWIGACSHILLDALTRESQMLVPHLVGMRNEIAAIEREGFRFSRLLWYALSAAGLGTLLLAYALLIRNQTGRWSWVDRRESLRTAAWLAALLLPFLVIAFVGWNPGRHWSWRYHVHHFVYGTVTVYLVVMGCSIGLLGLTLRLRQALSLRRAPEE